MLRSAMQDVRFGLRMLRKNYGFTAVVVLTLALGIGANATVFTVVNTVLFKGLPFEEPDRIVAITSNNRAENQERLGASYLNFLDWQAQSQSFEDLAAVTGTMRNISDPGLPMEFVISARVSANTFSLLGIDACLRTTASAYASCGASWSTPELRSMRWLRNPPGDWLARLAIRLSQIDFDRIRSIRR